MNELEDRTTARLTQLRRLREDLLLFGEQCLKIKPKDPRTPLIPFTINSAQRILHEAAEEQRARKGWVRKIIVKGRQQGISTYVGARFYHKAALNRGRNVYILTHDDTGTQALFEMVDRYHMHNPLRPHTGNNNVKELEFDRLDSSYFVATAGNKAAGRGKMITLFHGSEVAFWPNAKEHFGASVQAVPMLPETEIFLESTANGVTGEFYERWQDAIGGVGDYEPVFIPWFLQSEYVRPDLVAEGFEPSTDAGDDMFSEVEYMEMFNLTLEQMAWRRAKKQELRELPFDQEYPATSELAFQQKQVGAYQSARSILRARKRKDFDQSDAPLILGVDPAGEGGDRFAIAFRRGYKVEQVIYRDKIDTVTAVNWLQSVIDEHNPARVFVDSGGLGKSILSVLRAKGARYNLPYVHGVNFGAKSQFKMAWPKKPGPKLRRAEMHERAKQWLELEEGVKLPDVTSSPRDLDYMIATGDAIQGDAIETKIKKSLTNDLELESKQDIKARGARSPDLWDAIILTFADTSHIVDFDKAKPIKQFGLPERDVVPDHPNPSYDEDWGGGGDGGWMG